MSGQVVGVLRSHAAPTGLVHMHQVTEVVEGVLGRVLRTQRLLVVEGASRWLRDILAVLGLLVSVEGLREVVHAVAGREVLDLRGPQRVVNVEGGSVFNASGHRRRAVLLAVVTHVIRDGQNASSEALDLRITVHGRFGAKATVLLGDVEGGVSDADAGVDGAREVDVGELGVVAAEALGPARAEQAHLAPRGVRTVLREHGVVALGAVEGVSRLLLLHLALVGQVHFHALGGLLARRGRLAWLRLARQVLLFSLVAVHSHC